MTRRPKYRTLNNGSIDYDHYIRNAHAIRSRSAHRGLRAMARSIAALVRRVLSHQRPAIQPRNAAPRMTRG